MNILFFLTPKSEVAHICEEDTLRQALEKMEFHRYSAVPVLTRGGKYMGTITEGDLLWGIKNRFDLNLKEAESVPVTAIPRRADYLPRQRGRRHGQPDRPRLKPEFCAGGR